MPISVSSQFPLYLIIDEYDNFTNLVLNEHGEKVYHAITPVPRDMLREMSLWSGGIVLLVINNFTS